jgi:hypothetical protein
MSIRPGTSSVIIMLTMYHVFDCFGVIFRQVDDPGLCLFERIPACSLKK